MELDVLSAVTLPRQQMKAIRRILGVSYFNRSNTPHANILRQQDAFAEVGVLTAVSCQPLPIVSM